MREPAAYGDELTYRLAAEFLADCSTVEDWGCGKGWFRTLRPDVVGVDGTDSPFADIVQDLRQRRSHAEGILLRHVLEHNRDWSTVLDNAAAAATRKLCVVLFTPLAEETSEIAFTDALGVPDISFSLLDLTAHLRDFDVEVERLETATQYGEETVLRCVRRTDR